MSDNQDFIAEGFSFSNLADAQLASQENKKIEYLEARMDYDYPEDILAIYEKIIEERVFKTPVGLVYLKHLQSFLLNQPEMEAEKIPPISIYATYQPPILRDNPTPTRERVQPPKEKKSPINRLVLSFILNVVLVIAVLAMFFIALGSGEANILNYERTLKNQYAGWEQELTEREKVIREKEKELNINISLEDLDMENN